MTKDEKNISIKNQRYARMGSQPLQRKYLQRTICKRISYTKIPKTILSKEIKIPIKHQKRDIKSDILKFQNFFKKTLGKTLNKDS
jgi:hypothetical protein